MTSQDITLTKAPDSVTSNTITVIYNANDFPPRSRIEISITLNGKEFYIANEFISVSKRFELEKLSQDVISTAATKILLYVKEDLDSEGGIWDTQDNMK